MSRDAGEVLEILENASEIMNSLSKELEELFSFRDLFFENHNIEMANEKNKYVDEKKDILLEKFNKIDVDTQIPLELRAQFLYLKGRCYNVRPYYDPRATQCLSRAVKLNPHLIDAWNELGESYWKDMNIKEAKASFEGALKHDRNRLSLRCLSIIVRQDTVGKKRGEATPAILKSVELAKESVAKDIKDGVSWTVLGNAYLCQFFMVSQDQSTLKQCMSAYKQAWQDPIAKGQPDLYYNRAIALKYEEKYSDALADFEHACRLDPPWEPPKLERQKLVTYLTSARDLVKTRARVKPKRLRQYVQSIDHKHLGVYGPGTKHTFSTRKDVALDLVTLDSLQEGSNDGKVILAKVVGSIHNESAVPFTFAMVDSSMECVCVTVYNWADGRGAIIGDSVAIPEPKLTRHSFESPAFTYDFKSIRVNNPMLLLINGKRVGREQYASTRVTSTYETH